MATRENNTMAEFCNKMMKTIADAKMEPDADMEFLGALEGDILTYLKPPVPDTGTAGGAGAPAGGAPVGPPGMDQMMPAMASVMGGGGSTANGPGSPNPDEMRRMLGQ